MAASPPPERGDTYDVPEAAIPIGGKLTDEVEGEHERRVGFVVSIWGLSRGPWCHLAPGAYACLTEARKTSTCDFSRDA